MMFPKDFKEFVELLIKHKVEYILVGGYAVGLHGYPRFTDLIKNKKASGRYKDLDDLENLRK